MPDWPRAVDPGLLLRLLRRAQRPGLSRPGQAQRIVARHLGMAARSGLADRLTARGQGVSDAHVPIVHARPSAAPEAPAGPAAPAPAAPLVVHLTERVEVPVLQRTLVQAPEAASPPGGRGQQAHGLLRRDAGHERGTPQTLNTGASPQAADEAADRPSSRSTETVPSGQAAPSPRTAPAAQAAPAPQAAPVPAVLPSLRSWELQPSAGSPGRADGVPPDPAAAAVLPLARGRPAEAGAATTDRSARPPGAAGSESPVRDTAPATLPVVISSRVPPEDAVAAGLPAGIPLANVAASARAVLPVVPEQAWPGPLSPAVLQRRPPLPLAAGPAGPSAVPAQPAIRTGSPLGAPAVPAAAARAARTPALPNGRPVPATPRAGAGLDQADIDRLTDTVHARLLRRLAIERERRGGAR
jgi:hypothetical protein